MWCGIRWCSGSWLRTRLTAVSYEIGTVSAGSVLVDVQLASTSADIPAEDEIQRWVALTIAAASTDDLGNVETVIRVVDEDEIHGLNRDFRQIDRPTNVLSFPAGAIDGLPEGHTRMLGDIVICAPIVTREADSQGKPASDHWFHLVIHGTLHLLGFDHVSDVEAKVMEGLETRILDENGISDPYEHRTGQ